MKDVKTWKKMCPVREIFEGLSSTSPGSGGCTEEQTGGQPDTQTSLGPISHRFDENTRKAVLFRVHKMVNRKYLDKITRKSLEYTFLGDGPSR